MAGGRPTKMTEGVIRILEDCFAIGCSDTIACIRAGIVPSTLYKYCDENPEFSERKELLKEMPKYKALRTVDREIEIDGNLAFKYLERKMKDEFAPQNKHDVNLGTQENNCIQVEFVNGKRDIPD